MSLETDSLHLYLKKVEQEYDGGIVFLKPTSYRKIEEAEKVINWKLPVIFKYFFTQESNGIIISNKRILSIFEPDEKKTWVDNLARYNDATKSLWFKGRPHIFEDYVIIGNELSTLFCLSKKYQYENPSIYICRDPNSHTEVNFYNLELTLEGLIRAFVSDEFED